MDDIDAKKQMLNENTSSVASRRPVRRKTKPKNEDFEYDLSNLLKREAQGYRDSLSTTNSKSSQTKKKVQENQINYDNLNKDCCGALIALTKKSVDRAEAHLKTNFTFVFPQKDRPPNIFVRPMLPKIISRGDKISPKKESNEDPKECSSPSKEIVSIKDPAEDSLKNKDEVDKDKSSIEVTENTVSTKDNISTKSSVSEIVKPKSIPPVVPIKLRRQSLEVMKNPLINKNIKDFTKSGMKTKILVIKPIHRNKDGTQTLASPLKFQTIKLKDPNKTSSKEEKDQVMVVKVPKVDCAKARPIGEVCNTNTEKPPSASCVTPIENLTPNDSDNLKTVENSDIKIKHTVPPAAELSNGPTDAEEVTSNENNNEILDESSNVEDYSIITDNIVEPVSKTSENVNTTI